MPKRKADQHEPAAEDDELAKREADLARQKEELDERERLLKKREEELELAEEEFTSEATKAYGATKPDDVLTLNVGGTKLQVLRSTLCYVEGSLLANMFSGRWDDNLVKDDQGAFFLDHPYEQFKALIDFFRTCKLAASGPKPLISDLCEVASNAMFMRMVDHYHCTPALYPLDIVLDKAELSRNDLTICQSSMSVEYHPQPEDDEDTSFFRFSPIGHCRLVKRVCFRLENQGEFAAALRASDGWALINLDFSCNEMTVRDEQSSDGTKKLGLVEMNERCGRAVPDIERLKPGDTFQFEFDTLPVDFPFGVRFSSIKVNGRMVFSSADRPQKIFGDDSTCRLDPSYGEFLFYISGKISVIELALA